MSDFLQIWHDVTSFTLAGMYAFGNQTLVPNYANRFKVDIDLGVAL
jgi:hypothetical protein